MAAAVQIQNVNPVGNSIIVSGLIVLSGNYPPGGDALNFAAATQHADYVGMLPAAESLQLLQLDAWSENGADIQGANSVHYSIVFTRAGTPSIVSPVSGAKLKVAALNASPSTEHSAAAYESQYTGDVIAFMAVFQKL